MKKAIYLILFCSPFFLPKFIFSQASIDKANISNYPFQKNINNAAPSSDHFKNLNRVYSFNDVSDSSLKNVLTSGNNASSLCQGSLGDPVVNITFGSGTNPAQALPTIVAGASTTMTFVSVSGNPAQPTPLDGQYTITNNIPYNAAWFSGSGNHTPNEPNGFMAFYNASELPSEFYSQTVNNLCGSTTYEFAAWIANAVNPAVLNGVLPNITFNIEQTDGTILAAYNTGGIAENQSLTWNQYGFFFTTPSNVSTIVLKMINNSPGGTATPGNDFAVDDITFRPCGPIATASFSNTSLMDSLNICEGIPSTIYGTISTGYIVPNFLWQVSTDNGTTWTDIPNSNNLSLAVNSTITGTQRSYLYRMMTGEGNNVNSQNCRVASNLVFLNLNPSPKGSLKGSPICLGDSSTLIFGSIFGNPPFNINFTINSNSYSKTGTNNGDSFNLPFLLNDTSTLTLNTIQDANGCITSLDTTIVLPVNPLPQGGITGGKVCEGDSVAVVFNSTNGTAPFEVVLSDGTNQIKYYNVQSGVLFNTAPLYTSSTLSIVSISSNNGTGCSRYNAFNSPSATIQVDPAPKLKFDIIPAICIQEPAFQITQAAETSGLNGNGAYTGDGVSSTGNFSPINAGVGKHKIVYKYTATDGCIAMDSSYIIVNPTPKVNAGVDLLTCLGFPIQLNATGASTYLWSPTTGLDHADKPNPIATIDSTTTYIVLGTDSNGCTASDTITVSVSKAGLASFAIPNAFTPNGDGHNDCFGISKWGPVTIIEFSIFNRWGQIVFSTKNPTDCWDGTFNGKMQEAGGYPYIIKAITPCGNINKTGIVMLIR